MTTPIEKYNISGKTVFVKREDMYGQFPMPPLGKIRGLQILLNTLYEQGIRIVGCWDTRVSKLGQAVAVLSSRLPGMKAIISYPVKKGNPIPESIVIAEKYKAEIYPIRGNHVDICFSIVRKYVQELGGYMVPFGLECVESVDAISSEANTLPHHCFQNGTLVLTCGSGVTLAGLLNGLPALPDKIIGISSGRAKRKIEACVAKYSKTVPKQLTILEAEIPYDCSIDFPCPFNSHPNYDLKAWKYLVENINSLKEPILFWNIGA